jgi:cytochrome b561
MKPQPQKYPVSMIVFHTLIAAFMIAALVLAWCLDDNKGLIGLHKSLGVTVLLLAVLRLLNRFRFKNAIPESVNPKGSLQRTLEKSVHGMLYLTMFGLPFVGWMMSNAFGYPASFFGLFNLPTLVEKNEALGETLLEMHELGANVFIGLLVLHLAGGILHFIKHKQNVFKRMMP